MTTAAAAAPVITLKKIEWSARQSQETNSFVANLYVDGVLLGEVSNTGQGGSDFFRPAKAESRALYDATVARLIAAGAEDTKYSCPLEDAYNEVLEAHLKNKLAVSDYRRHTKKNVLFVIPGEKGGARTVKLQPTHSMQKHIDWIMGKYPEAVVLNVLPEDEAIKLFSEASA